MDDLLKYYSYSKDEEVRKIGIRVMNELVEPFRDIEIDDEEFACLKAVVFFDPNIAGLQNVDQVRKVRKQVQVLMNVKKTLPVLKEDINS